MSRLRTKRVIKVINKGIALNPTTITFTQTSKKVVDGAFVEEKVTRSIRVLIYIDDSQKSININTGTQGTSYSSEKYKMIADKDADLDVASKQSIEFESNGDKYKIKAVYPQIVEDTICGYICDLERMD